jgi:hypothetical protein
MTYTIFGVKIQFIKLRVEGFEIHTYIHGAKCIKANVRTYTFKNMRCEKMYIYRARCPPLIKDTQGSGRAYIQCM